MQRLNTPSDAPPPPPSRKGRKSVLAYDLTGDAEDVLPPPPSQDSAPPSPPSESSDIQPPPPEPSDALQASEQVPPPPPERSYERRSTVSRKSTILPPPKLPPRRRSTIGTAPGMSSQAATSPPGVPARPLATKAKSLLSPRQPPRRRKIVDLKGPWSQSTRAVASPRKIGPRPAPKKASIAPALVRAASTRDSFESSRSKNAPVEHTRSTSLLLALSPRGSYTVPPSTPVSPRVILRIFVTYGYAELQLLRAAGIREQGSTSAEPNESMPLGSKQAYISLEMDRSSTFRQVSARLKDALEKRKLTGLCASFKKFELVERATRTAFSKRETIAQATNPRAAVVELDLVAKVAPKAPRQRKTVEHLVIKHLSYGRKQHRWIRLTPEGIENIRRRGDVLEISSKHLYSEIFYTALLDEDMLCITYTDAKEHKYQTQSAVSIVQEINERMSASLRFAREWIRPSEKKAYERKARAAQNKIIERVRRTFTTSFGSGQIQKINEIEPPPSDLSGKRGSIMPSDRKKKRGFHRRLRRNRRSSDVSDLISHNEASKMRKPRTQDEWDMWDQMTRTEKAQSVEHESAPNLSPAGTSEGAPARRGKGPNRVSVMSRALKSWKPHVQKMQLRMDRILVGNSTEGAARKRFFSGQKKRRLAADPEKSILIVRQFCDSMKAYIKKHRVDDFSEMLKAGNDEEQDEVFDRVIEASLQRTVVNPIYKSLVDALSGSTSALDKKFSFTSRRIALGTQEDFGIKEEHRSSNNWAPCVAKLSLLEKIQSPTMQLKTLVTVAHSIFEEYNTEAIKHKEKPKLLNGDDFFPIFVFVMAQSGMRRPHLNKRLMWGLCSKRELQGEGGYYFTVFEAALLYITEGAKDSGASGRGQQNGAVDDAKTMKL